MGLFLRERSPAGGSCVSFQVIMWMLKEGRGMVDTVSKIGQFFPSKLPEYQDQCVSDLPCTGTNWKPLLNWWRPKLS